jgi:FemAB-related protein (PEP-CTERM system-associated)
MQVSELRESEKTSWDAYLEHSRDATIYHLAGWKDVMEDTFGLQTHFLLARENGRIAGVLPLLYAKSVFAGRYLTSMPGAVCAETEQAGQALIDHAKGLVHAHDAQYLILRDSRRKWSVPDLVTNEDHCTLLVELADDPELIWRGFNRRVRQSTNKAIAAGLEVAKDPGQLESFYPVYAEAMRNRGTPTQGIDFFRNMLGQFPDHFTALTVRHEGEILGGGFVGTFRGTVYQTWGGMLRKYYDRNPNYLLYWETLKHACEAGHQWLDLGRSAWHSGGYRFKKHWLSEPRQFYQQFYLNTTSQAPSVGSSREEDANYRAFIKIWRRLPLPVTEWVGPQLRAWMPFG